MVHQITVSFLHAALIIGVRDIKHNVRAAQKIPIDPLILGRPSVWLGRAGKRHLQPNIRVAFFQTENLQRGKCIKSKGPAAQKKTVTCFVELLQRFRKRSSQICVIRGSKASMTCKTDGFFTRVVRFIGYESIFKTAINASLGICTVPNWRMRFLPSFCFSSSFFFLVISPP